MKNPIPDFSSPSGTLEDLPYMITEFLSGPSDRLACVSGKRTFMTSSEEITETKAEAGYTARKTTGKDTSSPNSGLIMAV